MNMLKINRTQVLNAICRKCYSNKNKNEIEILQTDILKDVINTENKDFVTSKHWSLFKSLPESFNHSLSNVILFPGQGTQFVGMGQGLIKYPKVQQLFESASQYLNYDLLKVCLKGPAEKLNKTIHCQPAIYVVSLAALEMIKEQQPELIENCIATAGNSLGEITSLVFSGALSFEAGLHFVRIRAENMEKACLKTSSSLMTVYLTPKARLGEAMQAAKQYCFEKLNIENPVCQVSTYLFTECKVIGGHSEALDFIETFGKEFRLKGTKRLNVSGAFHTPLMEDASKSCYIALKRIKDIKTPQINVMSNVTGTVHTTVNEIKRLLVKQICAPVLWEQILMRMYMRPSTYDFPSTIEIGPGTTLGPTVKRVNEFAHRKYTNISV